MANMPPPLSVSDVYLQAILEELQRLRGLLEPPLPAAPPPQTPEIPMPTPQQPSDEVIELREPVPAPRIEAEPPKAPPLRPPMTSIDWKGRVKGKQPKKKGKS